VVNKWAEGLAPRSFRWVIADRLAVCERPGGCGTDHRRVRRVEEILWLGKSDIDLIFTLTVAPYNLHDYREHGLEYMHMPFAGPHDGADRLQTIYSTLSKQVATQRVLMHRDSIGDRLTGLVAGYLLWTGLVAGATNAIAVTEQLLAQELRPTARQIVTMAMELTDSQDSAGRADRD